MRKSLYKSGLITAAIVVLPSIVSISVLAATSGTDPGWGDQPKQQQQQNTQQRDQMREAMTSRNELTRLVFGIPGLEKQKGLAITKAQAKSLQPIIAKVKKDGVLTMSQSGFRVGGRNSSTPPDPKAIEKATKALQNMGTLCAGSLTKMEKILNAKQLGAIDAMQFDGLGGWGGRGGNNSGQGGNNQGQNGQNGGNSGNRQGRTGFGGGGGVFGGGQMTQAQIDKLRKQMEERQKEQEAKTKKALEDCIKLIDKRASGK